MKYLIKFLDLRDKGKKKCYLHIEAYNDGRYINTNTEIVTKRKATRMSLSLANELQIKCNEHRVFSKTPFIVEVK